MKKSILLLAVSLNAEPETLDITEWYEKQADFLGNRFLDELHLIYSQVLSFPESFGWYNKYGRIRKSRLPHSPYNVYYLVENSEIRSLKSYTPPGLPTSLKEGLDSLM